MKSLTFLLSLSLLYASCSSDRPQRSSHEGSGAAIPGGPNDPATGGGGAGGGDSKGGTTDPLPQLTYNVGSAMRLLDGRALTVIYNRVFPRRAYGFEHCKNNRFPELTDCTASVFEPQERPFVGTVDIYTPQFNRGPQNIRQAEDLTLNYTRTLRVALSRECDAMVNREFVALNEGKQAGNFLVKELKPTKAALEEFFRRLLGIEGTGIAVDIGADKYLASFETYTGGKSDPDTLKRGYYGLCIAISMDPQIFIY